MRKLSFVCVIALVAALGGTATAKNGAEKAPMYVSDPFQCDTGATNTTGPTFGFANMNLAGNPAGTDKTFKATVALKGATPNTTYDIYLNQDPGDCPTTPNGTLTTNGQGNGNATFSEAWVPGATMFWVSADGTPNGAEILRSTAVALN